jgi:hypothetical protein
VDVAAHTCQELLLNGRCRTMAHTIIQLAGHHNAEIVGVVAYQLAQMTAANVIAHVRAPILQHYRSLDSPLLLCV